MAQTLATPVLYSLDEQFEIKRQIRLEIARKAAINKDILLWGAMVMPHIFYLPFCGPLHGHFVAIRKLPFTNTLAPRFHAKTAIKCVLIPTFQAIYEAKEFDYYLNVQATDTKANAINRTIRMEFESNLDILELAGDQMGVRWADEQFVLANGVCFQAIGAGQSIRGINYRSRRPNYILIDDLYNEQDINNPEAAKKKRDWFWGTLYPARAQARPSSIHVQGTAISPSDLMTELQSSPDVVSKTFRAVTDWDLKTVLWPQLNTFESLIKDMGLMGTHIFMREMQNEPRDETTAIIKMSWLYKPDGSSWEYDPIDLKRRLAETEPTIFLSAVRLGIDPSIGKDMESDPAGYALVLETVDTIHGQGNEFWIEWIEDARLSLDARRGKAVEIAGNCPPNRPVTEMRVEAIGGFDDFAQYLINTTNLPVSRVEWVKDKITTLESRSHYFENGKVHLSRLIPREIRDRLVSQLTNNYPDHDDMRDAVLLTMDLEAGSWDRFMR